MLAWLERAAGGETPGAFAIYNPKTPEKSNEKAASTMTEPALMPENDQPAERLADLPHETRELLSNLTKEDIATITAGLPIIRMIIGFGKVTKWLAISLFGILVGFVMLSDSISKILAWFKQP